MLEGAGHSFKNKGPLYNVLLGDTTNANNVSAKNSAVASLDLLGGVGLIASAEGASVRGHAPLEDFKIWGL